MNYVVEDQITTELTFKKKVEQVKSNNSTSRNESKTKRRPKNLKLLKVKIS